MTEQLAGLHEDMQHPREQADRHHRDLKASLDKIEEHAVVTEMKAETSEKGTRCQHWV